MCEILKDCIQVFYTYMKVNKLFKISSVGVQCMYEYFDRYLYNCLKYIYVGKQAVWNVTNCKLLVYVWTFWKTVYNSIILM